MAGCPFERQPARISGKTVESGNVFDGSVLNIDSQLVFTFLFILKS